MNCKHHYRICRRCNNPLRCNLCDKTPDEIYKQRIVELIAERDRLRLSLDAAAVEYVADALEIDGESDEFMTEVNKVKQSWLDIHKPLREGE